MLYIVHEKICSMFVMLEIRSRTPKLQGLLDNIIECDSDNISVRSKVNFPVKNDESPTSITTTGHLSRQIEKNLKASTDFYVSSENFAQTDTTCTSKIVSITPMDSSHWTSSDGYFTASSTSHRRSGKATLDKYFRATKTSQNLQNLNVEKPIITTKINSSAKNSKNVRRQRLNALQIDDDFGRPSLWPISQQKRQTNTEGEKLFLSSLFNRKFKTIN